MDSRRVPSTQSAETKKTKRRGMSIRIRSSTWGSDSHGLYDYESAQVFRNSFRCSSGQNVYRVVRRGTEVAVVGEDDHAEPTSSRLLSTIYWEDGAYHLMPGTRSGPHGEKNWVVARHKKDRTIELSEGDIVKLGRYRLRVRETVTTEEQALESRKRLLALDEDDADTAAPELENAIEEELLPDPLQVETTVPEMVMRREEEDRPFLHEDEDQTGDLKTCKICLAEDEEDEPGNPLVAPCRCKGSMQWVHLDCLRQWMRGRLNIKSEGPEGPTFSFFWRNLECELCKLPYPTTVSVPGEEEAIELFEVPQPQVPYLTLEPRNQQSKGLYVVSLAGREAARLGRGQDSDIRLPDISVSRCHAHVRYIKPRPRTEETGSFIIEDERSKFGTLLEIREPVRLEPGMPVTIQAGRSLLTICTNKNRAFVPSCFSSRPSVANDIKPFRRSPSLPAPVTRPFAEPPHDATSRLPSQVSHAGSIMPDAIIGRRPPAQEE